MEERMVTIGDIIRTLTKDPNTNETNKKTIGILNEAVYANPFVRTKNISEIVMQLLSCNLIAERLNKFYLEACSADMELFSKTMFILDSGLYSKEDLDKNMELPMALPLISEEAGSFVKPGSNGWNSYCLAQHENFKKRLQGRKM